MQQLTGLDEMFLALDNTRTTGHAAGIAFFTASGAKRDEVAFLRERVAERLPLLPLLRWVLKDVPFAIDQRYWVSIPDIDLRYHVTGVQVPAPGGRAEVQAVLDGIMRELLPRDRPMWRLYVLEGLADDQYAYVMKITHGVADGSVIWACYERLCDDPPEEIVSADDTPPEPPGRLGMLGKGAVGLARKPMAIARLQADLARWAAKRAGQEPAPALSIAARLLPGELSKPLTALANKVRPDDAPEVASLVPTLRPPASPFNGRSTSNVTSAQEPLPLAELRKVGKHVGGTINDAVLAVVAGALRRFMEQHGGVPDKPLIVTAPISWRTGQEAERWANQIWMLFMPIPTHLADPMERLRFANAAANQAKRDWDGVPGHLLRRASALVPGAVLGPGAKLMHRVPSSVNLLMYNIAVSNVKGPSVSPSFGGRMIEDYEVYGFLANGIGLLVGGQSLGDKIILTLTACRDIVPDYAELPALFRASLDELLALVDASA